MKNVMKLAVILAIAPLTIIASAASNTTVISKTNYKQVGNVVWHKQENVSPNQILGHKTPNNMVNLVFMRRLDNDSEQTSANISINDRFQVSLQPNSYSQVYSCAGMNLIGAMPTALKTNDLLKGVVPFELAPNGTYYFYVDVQDNSGNPSIVQITKDSASKILKTKKYQTHQISRVVPNCPVIEKPVVKKSVQIERQKQPKLEKEVHIELEVLFDTNKHFIKPKYYQEIKEVAEFMTAYSNTTTILEGHTDNQGSVDYNKNLSQRRANAIKAVLVNKFGIASSRLKAVGYGETSPRVPNDSSVNLQKNRRVIAVINE